MLKYIINSNNYYIQAISVFNTVKQKLDSNKTNDIHKNIKVEEVSDTKSTEIIEPVENYLKKILI